MANEYSNLTALQKYLSLASPDSSDNEKILGHIRNASRAIDRVTRRKFYPRYETRFYDLKDRRGVLLDDDLLELGSIYANNGASQISNSVVFLQTGDNYGHSPYDKIVLNTSAGSTLNFTGTKQQAIHITGFWGYHETWASAFIDIGTSLVRNTGSNASLINIAGAGSFGTNASDVNFNAPRLSIGDTIRVQDELYHIVAAGSVATEFYTRPAANGTITASHASGASIGRFEPEPDIEFCARRWAAWTYAQESTPYSVRSAFPALGEVTINESAPPDVLVRLERFKKPRITGY